MLVVRVLDPFQGRPLPARILLQEDDGPPRFVAASEGHLELPRQGGRLQVVALAGGHWSSLRILSPEQRSDLEVLELRPAEPGADLDVVVRTPAGGAPDFHWEISPARDLRPADPDRLSRARFWARTAGRGEAKGGHLRLEALPPAVWQLRVEAPGSPPLVRSLELAAGAREELLLELEPGGTVTGLVGAIDGRRLAGARVFLLPANLGVMQAVLDDLHGERRTTFLEQAAVPGGRATTDEEGAWRIGPVAPGEYRVHAVAPGLLPGSLETTVRIRAGETTRAPVLVLRPGRTLSVQVLRAEDGAPLVGARVSFRPGAAKGATLGPALGWDEPPEPETGQDGRTRLPGLAPGLVTLRIAAPGRGTVEQTFPVPESGPVPEAVVRLQPALEIHGRVLDLATRAPVAGARILPRAVGAGDFLSSFLPAPDSAEHAARSAEDGSFVVTGLAAGTWTLQVEAPDHAPGRAGPFTLTPDLPPPEAEVLLGRGGEILVRVLDEAERPSPGRLVTVFATNAGAPRGDTTDADGQVLFRNLPPGEWTVSVLGGAAFDTPASTLTGDFLASLEMDSETVTVAEGARAEVTLGGPRQWGRLFGFVTRDGAPAAGLTVFLSQGMQIRSARTDASGLYEFEEAPPGDSMLMVGRFALGAGSGYTTLVHVPAGAEVQHDVALPGTRLRIRVLDAEDGTPVAGIPVLLRPRQGNQGGGMLTTDGRGEVLFEWLAPGDYVLVAGRAGMPFLGRADRAAAVVDPVHLTEDAGEQLLVLQVGRGARLRARVEDAGGRPVAGAGVFLLTPEGQPVTLMNLSGTAADGTLLLEGLPPGPHRVLARHRRLGTAEAPVLLRAGEEAEVTLRLAPGTLVVVTPVDRDGRPLRGVQAVALDERGAPVSVLVEAGRMLDQGMAFVTGRPQELGPLAPGRYTILLQAPGGSPVRHPVEVPPGGGRMELRLPYDP